MLALLKEATQSLGRQEAMREVIKSYERLAREDPAGPAGDLDEGRRWDGLAGDGLAEIRDEFPEHNS